MNAKNPKIEDKSLTIDNAPEQDAVEGKEVGEADVTGEADTVAEPGKGTVEVTLAHFHLTHSPGDVISVSPSLRESLDHAGYLVRTEQ